MHQGVIRDMEQQRIKRERQVDFEMQRQLEEEYRKVQTVSDSTDKWGEDEEPGQFQQEKEEKRAQLLAWFEDGNCLGLARSCCLPHTRGAHEVDTLEVNHGSGKLKYRSTSDAWTNWHIWYDYMPGETKHAEAMQYQHPT
jgi:hypothetical protein